MQAKGHDYRGNRPEEPVRQTRTPTIDQANRRQTYRVAPSAALTPRAVLFDAYGQPLPLRVTLVDLSTTGALLRYCPMRENTPRFPPGAPLQIAIDLSGLLERLTVRLYASQDTLAHIRTDCRVVRSAPAGTPHWHDVTITFAAPLPQPQEDLLHAVLLKMQQILAAQGRH